jgi:hypothetical protein
MRCFSFFTTKTQRHQGNLDEAGKKTWCLGALGGVLPLFPFRSSSLRTSHFALRAFPGFGALFSSVRTSYFVLPTCVCLCALLYSSCAYYSTSSSFLPAHIKTIAIPLFANETYEYGLAEKLTDAVIDKFMATSRLKVVSRKTADSILEVVVRRVTDEPFTIGERETAQQYRLTVSISAVYRDIKTNEVVWESDALEGWETYELTGAGDRDQALNQALEKLAADIFNQTLAGW